MHSTSADYAKTLAQVLESFDWSLVDRLGDTLFECWQKGGTVFLCGNGGSAANASHLANDLLYGINPRGKGLRVVALTDNASLITCLGNDTGYDNIFSRQLETQASEGGILIAFSGSGNSANILKALQSAKRMRMKSAAVLGFDGGACKELADYPIHFAVDDMQVAEDLQQSVGHMLTLRIKDAIAEHG